MELDRLPPEWLGANIVLEGIPELTRIPPASRLVFDERGRLRSDRIRQVRRT